MPLPLRCLIDSSPCLVLSLALFVTPVRTTAADALPDEPLAIGHEPQFLFDNCVVDNHWALQYKREAVRRVFHQAVKHPENPVMTGDQPSSLWVIRDEEAGLFRMYYQANVPTDLTEGDSGPAFEAQVAYAESKDGVHWDKPHLDLFPGLKPTPNNIVIGRGDVPQLQASGPSILEVPEEDRRGYRFLMLYRGKGRGVGKLIGIHVIGSNDGIHWDEASGAQIAHLHSDTHNTVCYDAARGEYVMFCRPKHIYRVGGETMLDTGASRRVARMTSKSLWTDWLEHARPQTILIPDETDAETRFSFFYGMPTRYWAGIYWGFLEPFRMNDFVYTQLALSRDGVHFVRPPDRSKLIEYGEKGSWDDEMIFASPAWVEVGDEWWIYYSGWDGPHGTSERTGAVGLAKIRKEGFVSLRGPRNGGVVCTRTLIWPGGDLVINADARGGEVQVRVSDENRTPLEGFDYQHCEPFRGDDISDDVVWKERSMDELKGQVVRLEFFLREADLFAFRASASE